MEPSKITPEINRFCVRHYALVRDWVECNEELKIEMANRFPHTKTVSQHPVVPMDDFKK